LQYNFVPQRNYLKFLVGQLATGLSVRKTVLTGWQSKILTKDVSYPLKLWK